MEALRANHADGTLTRHSALEKGGLGSQGRCIKPGLPRRPDVKLSPSQRCGYTQQLAWWWTLTVRLPANGAFPEFWPNGWLVSKHSLCHAFSASSLVAPIFRAPLQLQRALSGPSDALPRPAGQACSDIAWHAWCASVQHTNGVA